jgi:hypothetical protein
MLITFPSPIPELLHAPLPLKMLRAKERALTPCFSIILSLDSHLSPLKSLGVHQAALTQCGTMRFLAHHNWWTNLAPFLVL